MLIGGWKVNIFYKMYEVGIIIIENVILVNIVKMYFIIFFVFNVLLNKLLV